MSNIGGCVVTSAGRPSVTVAVATVAATGSVRSVAPAGSSSATARTPAGR